MTRFFAFWIYTIVLGGACGAVIRSEIEERRFISNASARGSTLFKDLKILAVSANSKKRLNSLNKWFHGVQTENNDYLSGIAVCTSQKKSNHFAIPDGRSINKICDSPRLLELKELRLGNMIEWAIDKPNGIQQIFATRLNSNRVILLIQDLDGINRIWLKSFSHTLSFIGLGGFVIFFGIRIWPCQIHKTKAALIKDSSSDTHSQENADSPILRALKSSMGDRGFVVIANREPYIHRQCKDRIEVMRPASGLVTGLEPILRQCGGLWIAHGSGDADRLTANSKGEIPVPPQNARYLLKRIWLTHKEEAGYYFGFSNEGLWPLCHLAHTRPIFRLSDWNDYQTVNQKFCDAIPDSAIRDHSLILAQDYHFALLPRMLRQRAGSYQPKVSLFWHIPWPNPEAFGICPWSVELLKGMLGSDLIGFHTQYHCNNFLETCNRLLEARVDLEHFSVTMENRVTFVRAFPIGIGTPPVRELSKNEIYALKARYGIHSEWIAVGVDRLDYTKGLIERMRAVERFLEKYPQFQGKFTLVQMGSPSRSDIPAYKAFSNELDRIVAYVNHRFGIRKKGYLPIRFLPQHHEWNEIQYFYQLGDICMVTSLHDGMNLVAKEYVWCQKPERGSLILSKFTGASRELTESFVVNPYSIEEMADAIAAAIALPSEEKAKRMLAMRLKVETNNAYRWAADLVQEMIKRNDTIQPQILEPGRLDKSKSTNLSCA